MCSFECIDILCKEDFLERHEGFIITIVGLLGGAAGLLLNYFIKSRCTKILCCCSVCYRTPIELNQDQIEIVTN